MRQNKQTSPEKHSQAKQPQETGSSVKNRQVSTASVHADAALLKFVASLAEEGSVNVGALFKHPDGAEHAPTKASFKGSLLNVADAAAFLNVSPKTLANWRVSGDGPRFSKIGGRVCYAKSDLKAFIAANLKQSTSDQGGNNA